MEGFGQTETTLDGGKPRRHDARKPGSMGKPSPQYRRRDFVDADGNPVRRRRDGRDRASARDEACPCGLFLGYYRDEEKTKAAWHDGMYHTGDTGLAG